jgi:hypothetical protein
MLGAVTDGSTTESKNIASNRTAATEIGGMGSIDVAVKLKRSVSMGKRRSRVGCMDGKDRWNRRQIWKRCRTPIN